MENSVNFSKITLPNLRYITCTKNVVYICFEKITDYSVMQCFGMFAADVDVKPVYVVS